VSRGSILCWYIERIDFPHKKIDGSRCGQLAGPRSGYSVGNQDDNELDIRNAPFHDFTLVPITLNIQKVDLGHSPFIGYLQTRRMQQRNTFHHRLHKFNKLFNG